MTPLGIKPACNALPQTTAPTLPPSYWVSLYKFLHFARIPTGTLVRRAGRPSDISCVRGPHQGLLVIGLAAPAASAATDPHSDNLSVGVTYGVPIIRSWSDSSKSKVKSLARSLRCLHIWNKTDTRLFLIKDQWDEWHPDPSKVAYFRFV